MTHDDIKRYLIQHGNIGSTTTERLFDFDTKIKVDGYTIHQVTYFEDEDLLCVYGLNESNEGNFFEFDSLSEDVQLSLSIDISNAVYEILVKKLAYLINKYEPKHKLNVFSQGMFVRPISGKAIGGTVIETIADFVKINKLYYYISFDDEGIYVRIF